MRIVVALGGNAPAKRGEPMAVKRQRYNVAVACEQLGDGKQSAIGSLEDLQGLVSGELGTQVSGQFADIA